MSADSTTPEFVRDSPGAAIYQELCARCHGDEGQGVDRRYEEPLHGDRSIGSLARLIERTMPDGKEEMCVGDDARQVAEYIYHEFYSLEARKRKGLLEMPRVELLRLTVPQYRNAVADLLAHFTPVPKERKRERDRDDDDDGEANEAEEAAEPAVMPGLRAEYYQSKGMSKADSLQLERVDPRVDFDFGEGSPVEDITADQFTVIWDGALFAPDTGDYEFRIRTENGARLYVNNDAQERIRKLRDDSSAAGQSALIDAWVSSGEMREKTARVFLLGGRQYPLRLEFFKYKEKTASIRLEWKPPHGTWSILDDTHLTTASLGRTFVLETPFPADDRSLGYERGSSISRNWQTATMKAASATTSEVVDRLPLLAGFEKGDAERESAVKDFVARFASIAFRRPLRSEEEHLYREALFEEAPNPEAGVRRAVALILMSPGFLYLGIEPVVPEADQHAIASSLAFTLWDSIPDQELREAAGKGHLKTAGQIVSQARRMLADPRAKAKMREFFHHWLEFEERDRSKDQEMFPEFDEAVMADLRRSLELFVEQVVWSEESDYRKLLKSDFLMLNDRLRQLYASDSQEAEDGAGAEDGKSDPAATDTAGADFEPVRLAGRAGVLTHPYLLSAFAYPNNTSPIHRGVFLTRNIMGRPLKPPPVAVAFKDEEFPADITMREKITRLTRDTACMSCHSVINPLGFALESFDAVGRWRTTDNDLPVDTRSDYVTDDGNTVEIASAVDVARFAVDSESAQRAFVNQLFHYLVKQDASAYGPGTLEQLRLDFAEDAFNMQNLMVRIATLAAGHERASTSFSKTES